MGKKDTSVIPKGFYCYSIKKGKRVMCPYWSIRKDKPEQENGYCAYLGKGDWGLHKDDDYKEVKSGKITKGRDLPFSPSLLWDAVKECEIKR